MCVSYVLSCINVHKSGLDLLIPSMFNVASEKSRFMSSDFQWISFVSPIYSCVYFSSCRLLSFGVSSCPSINLDGKYIASLCFSDMLENTASILHHVLPYVISSMGILKFLFLLM